MGCAKSDYRESNRVHEKEWRQNLVLSREQQKRIFLQLSLPLPNLLLSGVS
jgi:hypothetical protein